MIKTRKKAFTLAETIISLCVIGVVAAIAIPLLFANRDQQDTMLYRKAMYTVQRGLQKYMDSAAYNTATKDDPGAFLANLNNGEFCQALADQINTKGKVDCTKTGSFGKPNFISMDGIKYWFEDISAFTINGAKELKVSSLNGDKKPGAHGMIIRINYKGKVFTNNTDEYENKLITTYQKLKN